MNVSIPENINNTNLINVTGSGETETESIGWFHGSNVVGGDSPVSLSIMDQIQMFVNKNPIVIMLGGIGVLMILNGGNRRR